jgi:pyruvate/2-oxoglutarate dehydrogenase complex dihydrolipoamide dehydrogenase (E3) component
LRIAIRHSLSHWNGRDFVARALRPDICFIGGGSSLAPTIVSAAASGYSVALVQPEGSDGTRARLVRSMALRAAARDAVAGGPRHSPAGDIAEIEKRIGEISAAFPDSTPERFAALGVRVIPGVAHFKDRRTLVLADGSLMRARHFIIATGSVPGPVTIEGLNSVDHLTADTAFELAVLPGHLIVVGSGPAAHELAQGWRRLGSAVTLVATGEPLAGHDPEMAAVVTRALIADGVKIVEQAVVQGVQRHEAGIRLEVLSPAGSIDLIDGTHLLLAGPRVPHIAGLRLDKARVRHDAAGIGVSAALRTSNPRIYAVGDVTGEPHLAQHVEHQAAIVLAAIRSGRDTDQKPALLPRLVLTDPELAEVGLSPEQAASRHRDVRILRWPYAENARAAAEGRTAGHVKLVSDKQGKLLGAAVAGALASELIGLWTLALTKGMNVADLAGIAMPVCTFGEIGKRAAISYFPVEPRRRTLARKLAGLLRVFG